MRCATEIRRDADRRQHHPHVWNYHLSVLPGSPWTDVRLRKALNLAIDRDAVVGLMNGLAKPARARSIHRARGSASRLRHQIRPRRGEEAGRGSRLFKGKAAEDHIHHRARRNGANAVAADERIPAAKLQGDRHHVDFKVVELETLYTHWRKGAADEMNAGITANNIAYVTSTRSTHRALLPLRPDRAGGRQLGRLQESESRSFIDEASKLSIRSSRTSYWRRHIR